MNGPFPRFADTRVPAGKHLHEEWRSRISKEGRDGGEAGPQEHFPVMPRQTLSNHREQLVQLFVVEQNCRPRDDSLSGFSCFCD